MLHFHWYCIAEGINRSIIRLSKLFNKQTSGPGDVNDGHFEAAGRSASHALSKNARDRISHWGMNKYLLGCLYPTAG